MEEEELEVDAVAENIVEAARLMQSDILVSMLQSGSSPAETDEDGNTALHYAAYNSHLGVTRVLLLNNANGSIKTHKKKLGK